MGNTGKTGFLILVVLMLTSCSAFKTSMTPLELYNTLPTLTKTKFLKEDEINDSLCTCIKRDRTYNAPMGLSLKEDVKNGAQGIDEWVAIDKGNAYVLKNYKWIIVDYNVYYSTTVTQLFLEFDTYLCR